MSVQSEIERINSTVAEQTALIKEISDILDGKINPPPITEFAAKYGWVRYSVPNGSNNYITSNGTQYIDTGYAWKSENAEVYIRLDYMHEPNDESIFGSENSTPQYSGVAYAVNRNVSFYVGTSKNLLGKNVIQKQTYDLTVTMNNGKLTTKWNNAAEQNATYTGSIKNGRNIYIFANNQHANLLQKSSIKLRRFSMKDNGVLVRSFIPTIDPDGVPCLFDYCTGRYFYNAGTGTFAFSGMIKPIEESYVCSDNANAYPDGGIVDGYFYKKLPLQVSGNQGGAGGLVSYNVSNVEGAEYGFVLSGNYYVSQNKGDSSSAALCRVDFNTTTPVKVKVYCISYGENNYDFGILSNLNTMLTTSSSVDSTGVYKSFKGLSSSSEQLVTYDLPSGKSFISIKYRKDNSGNSNDDTLKFRIEISEA